MLHIVDYMTNFIETSKIIAVCTNILNMSIVTLQNKAMDENNKLLKELKKRKVA